MDIEGGESHALLGGAETLRRWWPVIVFEAGCKSTGEYGVTPDEMFSLVTGRLGYDLSTMARWLEGAPSLTAADFAHNWAHGTGLLFHRYP